MSKNTPSDDSALKKLQARIDYSFQDLSLLRQALNHKSYTADNNERLEFLGDSILNFVIAEALFSKFPDLAEGELSRARANLVKGETLAQIANELDLKNHIKLGSGELKSGGFNRPSILADAVEAIIGSVLLDSGFDSARGLILGLYEEKLQGDFVLKVEKDPKTQLQEHLQSLKLATPLYNIVSIKGEDHNQVFEVSCEVPSLEIKKTASGKSRRKAEQLAAKQVYDDIQKDL